jgi:hypothetical protein
VACAPGTFWAESTFAQKVGEGCFRRLLFIDFLGKALLPGFAHKVTQKSHLLKKSAVCPKSPLTQPFRSCAGGISTLALILPGGRPRGLFIVGKTTPSSRIVIREMIERLSLSISLWCLRTILLLL